MLRAQPTTKRSSLLTGLSHFAATLAPEGYSILFDGGHQPGRPRQRIKWRAASPPAIGSQESDGSALLRVLTARLKMPPEKID
jgi:hypothetical protein